MLRKFLASLWAFVLASAAALVAQTTPAQSVSPKPSSSAEQAGPATQLYVQLANVELDPQRVYRIRDASLDRHSVQITFNEGNIAFTHDVEGRITGAFFEGDANLLITPPTDVERASLGLFTGAAILSDEFTSAYLRFDGDVFNELKRSLRDFEDANEKQEFYGHAAPISRNLAESDAMRLLMSFLSNPAEQKGFLHMRVSGTSHGTYDLYFDQANPEPVAVAQIAQTRDGVYLDIWTSFAPGAQSSSKTQRSTPRATSSDDFAQNGPETSAEPDAANIGAIKISDYKIRARVLPPRQLEADTLVTLEVGAQPSRLLVFELSHFLQISAVTQVISGDERPLEFLQNPAVHGSQRERQGNDVVAVVLPQPARAGEQLQLRFRYAGDVLSDAGGGLLYVGARGTWFPNRGLSFARFDMEFRYPPGWTLVATGTPISDETKDGEQVAHWMSQQPMQTAGFNLGQYTRSATSAANVAVAAYASRSVERTFPRPAAVPDAPVLIDNNGRPTTVHPRALPPIPPLNPTPATHALTVAHEAAHTIDWLSSRIGPFPYSSLWLTQVPGHVGQGWPGLVFLSSYAFLTPDERARERVSDWNNLLYGKIMVPHETAHQWWGDDVGWSSYHDQWLTEALANYCALMVVEQSSPADFRTALDHYRSLLLGKNADGKPQFEAGPVTLGPRLSSSKFPLGYDVVAYGRGTWLIHMLRNFLREVPVAPGRRTLSGDDLFFAALRHIAQQHRYALMSNEDVERAFEAVLPASMNYEGHRSLEWFFQSWVNGTAIPRFELDDVKFATRAEKPVVTGKLLQKDAPEDFVSSVPIYAAGASGGKPVLLGRVFTEGEETTFRFTVPIGTRKLLIDPYQTVLRQP
jgi:hypothetical protein